MCLPMQETWVRPLGQEDPLKKIATHSSILAWIPMDRGAWWATVHGVTKSETWLSGYNNNKTPNNYLLTEQWGEFGSMETA